MFPLRCLCADLMRLLYCPCRPSLILALILDAAPSPPASPGLERVDGFVNAIAVVVGVQILFIETDDLRDRPEEIMPMVHQHIGEMAPKAFAWYHLNRFRTAAFIAINITFISRFRGHTIST